MSLSCQPSLSQVSTPVENLGGLLRKLIFFAAYYTLLSFFWNLHYIGEEDKIDCNKSEEETNTMHKYKKYFIHVWQQLCEGVQVEGVEMMEKGMVDQWKKINNKDNELKNFCHWVQTSTTIIMDLWVIVHT